MSELQLLRFPCLLAWDTHTLVISAWVTCPYESPNAQNGFPLPYILWTENDLVFWVRALETKWMIFE